MGTDRATEHRVEVGRERLEERRVIEQAVHRLELGRIPRHIAGRIDSHSVGCSFSVRSNGGLVPY